MKLKTAQPMTQETWAQIVDKQGLYTIGKDRVRIINGTPDQMVDANCMVYDKEGRKFGLIKVDNKPYKFLAFLVQ